MDIKLKVRPETLAAKADELYSEICAATGYADQLYSEAAALAGVWAGDAASEYIRRLNMACSDINNVLSDFFKHAADLGEAAGVYSAAGKAANEAAEGLPVSGIFFI